MFEFEKLGSFSFIDGLFWFRLGKGCISFGYKGLPENIHFTFSFSEQSPDNNIHLTKETSPSVRGNSAKPKITLLRFSKSLPAEIDLKNILLYTIESFFEELDIHKLRKKYKGKLFFISPSALQQTEEYRLSKNKFLDKFKNNIKIEKRKHIKIEGDLEDSLKKLLESPDYVDLFLDNLKLFNWDTQSTEQQGLLLYKKEAIGVFRMEVSPKRRRRRKWEWFKFRQDISIDELLKILFSDELIIQIKWKVKRSLVYLKYANTFEDTKDINNHPIILTASPKE